MARRKTPKRYLSEQEVKVRDLLDLADLEMLMEEIGEWKENLEGANMEHLPKYDEVSECYDALESAHGYLESGVEDLQDIEDERVTAVLDGMTKNVVNSDPRQSRAGRADELCGDIRQALEVLEANLDLPEGEIREALEAAVSQIEDGVSELEGIDFPGMF